MLHTTLNLPRCFGFKLSCARAFFESLALSKLALSHYCVQLPIVLSISYHTISQFILRYYLK